MDDLRFTSETAVAGVIEREFVVGDVPGVLWSPESGTGHAPLVLMGHGGGLHKKTPALVARAHQAVAAHGFNVVAIDAPGHGDRPRIPADEQARDDMRAAVMSDDKVRFEVVSVGYAISLAARAVPEWQATLDALQALPEIGPEVPVGYGGGISLGTAIGVPLTAADPRITAAIFGGGFFVYNALLDAARRITVRCNTCSRGTTSTYPGRPAWRCSTLSRPRRRPSTRTPATIAPSAGSASTKASSPVISVRPLRW